MIVFFFIVIIQVYSVRLAADALLRTNGVPKPLARNIPRILSEGLSLWQEAVRFGQVISGPCLGMPAPALARACARA